MDSAMSGLATGRKLESSEHLFASGPLVVGLITHIRVIVLGAAERRYTLLFLFYSFFLSSFW